MYCTTQGLSSVNYPCECRLNEVLYKEGFQIPQRTMCKVQLIWMWTLCYSVKQSFFMSIIQIWSIHLSCLQNVYKFQKMRNFTLWCNVMSHCIGYKHLNAMCTIIEALVMIGAWFKKMSGFFAQFAKLQTCSVFTAYLIQWNANKRLKLLPIQFFQWTPSHLQKPLTVLPPTFTYHLRMWNPIKLRKVSLNYSATYLLRSIVQTNLKAFAMANALRVEINVCWSFEFNEYWFLF